MNTKTRISLAEANNFVNVALKICHDQDGVYNPVLKDFAIKYSILAHFTDYPIDTKDIDDIYSDIYNSVTANRIRDIICDSLQLSALIQAVDESIEVEKNRLARTNKITKFLESLVDIADQRIENPETKELVNKVFAEVGKDIAEDNNKA